MSTLQALHDLLLDRSKWPDDFVWNYDDCTTCAIGLAYRAELIDASDPRHAHGYHFGIDDSDSTSVVLHHSRWQLCCCDT